MGTTYDVACKEPGYRLKARWNDGSFEFVILGPRDAGQLPCGGGQGELPLLADLVAATIGFVDWTTEGVLRDRLVADQLAAYDPEVQRIVLAR